MIRARVYEIQYGGFVADYVRYFENSLEIKKFRIATGYKVEVIK